MDWPSASESWSDTTVVSGWNRNPAKDPFSVSASPSDAPSEGAQKTILLVEDNRADIFLIHEAIQAAHLNADVQIVEDGEKAIQYFERLDADEAFWCPSLMILDINLPKRPGNEVLAHMRHTRRCSKTQVLVVTSSDSERDREEMSKFGVKGYFRKPADFAAFMKLGDLIRELLK